MAERLLDKYLDADFQFRSVEVHLISLWSGVEIVIDSGVVCDRETNRDTIVTFDRLSLTTDLRGLLLNKRLTLESLTVESPVINLRQRHADTLRHRRIFKTDIWNGQEYLNLSNLTMHDVRIRIGGYGTNELDVRDVDLHLSCSLGDSLLMIHRMSLVAPGVEFSAQGNLTPDSMAMQVRLAALSDNPVVKDLLHRFRIPLEGGIDVEARLSGGYVGQLPTIDASIEMHHGIFRDNLRFTASARINYDAGNVDRSQIELTDFHAQQDGLRVECRGRMRGFLEHDPQFDLEGIFEADLAKLSAEIPAMDGLNLMGSAAFRGHGLASLSQIRSRDWLHLQLAGRLSVRDLEMGIPAQDYRFVARAMELDVSNSATGNARISGTSRGVVFRNQDSLMVGLQTMRVDLRGENLMQQTSHITGELTSQGLRAVLAAGDLEFSADSSRAEIGMSSEVMSVVYRGTKLAIRASGVSANIGRGSILSDNLRSAQPRFDVSVFDATVLTDALPLDIALSEARVGLHGDSIRVDRATNVRIGRSQLNISQGMLTNLDSTEAVIEADLTGANLDADELFRAINQAAIAQHSPWAIIAPPSSGTPQDSILVPLTYIPPGVRARVSLRFDRAVLTGLNLDKVHAEMIIRDGCSRIAPMRFRIFGQRMEGSSIYQSTSYRTALSTLSIRSDTIDSQTLARIIPQLLHLTPMLGTLRGTVSFEITAQTPMNDFMTMQPEKMKAAASLKAHSLELLDNETFRRVSRLLLFSHRQSNIIDSLDVRMIADRGDVRVFPFLLSINRYRTAIGGVQNLDGQMSYQVSVLHSFIPFAFGVTVEGTFDKLKMGISRAWYKYMQDPAADAAQKLIYRHFVESIRDSAACGAATMSHSLGNDANQK